MQESSLKLNQIIYSDSGEDSEPEIPTNRYELKSHTQSSALSRASYSIIFNLHDPVISGKGSSDYLMGEIFDTIG